MRHGSTNPPAPPAATTPCPGHDGDHHDHAGPGFVAMAPVTAPTRGSRVTSVVAVAAMGAACAYTAMVNPNESSAFPQCPLRLVTGVDCAMCGGLRATHALLGGNIIQAVRQNLLVVLLAPLAIYTVAQWVAAQWGVRLPGLPVRRWMVWGLLAAAVAYTVVRNLGVGPGPWLHSDSF